MLKNYLSSAPAKPAVAKKAAAKVPAKKEESSSEEESSDEEEEKAGLFTIILQNTLNLQ